jgi:hypothetical protein
MAINIHTAGTLIYRCRLCHEEFVQGAVSHLLEEMTEMFLRGRGVRSSLGLIDLHNCSDGRVGAADFIGAKPER